MVPHKRLPTAFALYKRLSQLEMHAPYVVNKSETLFHIFNEFPMALDTRKLLSGSIMLVEPYSILTIYDNILEDKGHQHFWEEISTCWELWKVRNSRIILSAHCEYHNCCSCRVHSKMRSSKAD